MTKLLYICPFAHHPGHPPAATLNETIALKDAGVDVKLVTFCGIIDQTPAEVPEEWVAKSNGFLALLRRNTPTRWVLMVFETALTLMLAIRIYRREKFDVMYLRDGEPFLFLHHFLSLPFTGLKWIVSLTAAVVFTPVMPKLAWRTLPLTIYILVVRFVVNNPMWRPLYWASVRRNTFRFVTQNEMAKRRFSDYLNGVFGERVKCVPIGMRAMNHSKSISRKEARGFFGLPQDKFVLLSFGAPHSGKDLDVVFKALQALDGVWLLHGGLQAFSLGSHLPLLAERYGLTGRVLVRDYYVSEEEKPLYFAAADVIVLSYTRAFSSTASMLWEAAEYRMPVIASDNGELPHLVRNYGMGVTFRASDELDLVKAMRQFMGCSEQEIFAMKAGCADFSRDHSISKWTGRVLDLIGEMGGEVKYGV